MMTINMLCSSVPRLSWFLTFYPSTFYLLTVMSSWLISSTSCKLYYFLILTVQLFLIQPCSDPWLWENPNSGLLASF